MNADDSDENGLAGRILRNGKLGQQTVWPSIVSAICLAGAGDLAGRKGWGTQERRIAETHANLHPATRKVAAQLGPGWDDLGFSGIPREGVGHPTSTRAKPARIGDPGLCPHVHGRDRKIG